MSAKLVRRRDGAVIQEQRVDLVEVQGSVGKLHMPTVQRTFGLDLVTLDGRVPVVLGEMVQRPFAVDAEVEVAGTTTGTKSTGDESAYDAIQRRFEAASEFAAHIELKRKNGKVLKIAATVLTPNVVVTAAHGLKAEMPEMGDVGETEPNWPPQDEAIITIHVHDGAKSKRRPVNGRVIGRDDELDVLALEVDEQLSAPDLDAALFVGQYYFVIGQSAQACPDLSSVVHGIISATSIDTKCHVRGDSESGAGDSGGGVFSVTSGKLIAICVGNHPVTKKAVFAPIGEVKLFVNLWRRKLAKVDAS